MDSRSAQYVSVAREASSVSGRFVLALAFGLAAAGVSAQDLIGKIPADQRPVIETALDAGEPQDVLVTYDAAAIRAEAKRLQRERSLPRHDDDILRVKASGFAQIKAAVAVNLGAASPRILKTYEQLPVEFVRLENRASLEGLLADPRVTGISLPERHTRALAQSLPLINQPAAAQQGFYGGGTAVAVLDTGVDYTRAAFGSCAAPGPACKVIYSRDFAPDDGLKDDDGHGTNVAGIALGVAPDAKIVALDVFRSDGFAYSQDIIAAINWSIQSKSQYNIVAINLSLGSGRFLSPISSPANAYKRAIDNARDAGIVVVAASGNDGYTDSLASPAAVDTAVSVGAVYDSAIGAINWPRCSDPVTAADRVTCFSNSATFLTALAPGALINAAGAQMGGTSQAAPHIAGAVAVLNAAYPGESVNQLIARLAAGVAVTDPRNGLVKPRLDLVRSLGLDLVPDAFLFQDQSDVAPGVLVTSNPVTITGLVGSALVSVSAPGEYSVNGGAFVSEPRTVTAGDVIRVRVLSSTAPGGVASTSLTVGGVSDTFSVTTSATATVPAAQFAPASVVFGGVAIGTTVARTVTLSNSGSANLDITAFDVTQNQDFLIQSTDCGASLVPGQACVITIAFAPSLPAARAATLSVTSNAPGSPHAVPLSGTGVTTTTLGEALDNAALTFSVGGNTPWYGQTAVALTGGAAAQSGLLDHLQSTYLETTVTGPGVLSFYWKVSSEPNFDFLRLYVDGVELAVISGEVDWNQRTYSVGPGSHVVRWAYTKDGAVSSGADAGWIDAVAFTPGEPVVSLSPPGVDFGSVVVGASRSETVSVTNTGTAPLAVAAATITGLDYLKVSDTCSGTSIPPAGTCSVTIQFAPAALGARAGSLAVASNAAGSPHVAALAGSGLAAASLETALDAGSLTFTTGSSAPWFGQTAVTRVAGESTAQTGGVRDFETSYLETTVVGPGRLSFYWKVSSEPFYDRLLVSLDGAVQGWISGEVEWEQRVYDIGAGTHVVRWAYLQTAEEPGGADRGWLDQVSFQPLAAPTNLAEALDTPALAWRTTGISGSAASWTGQAATAVSGGDAAESPLISHSQTSEMRTTVKGPGVVSFQWKVSSEPGYDFLCFYQDFGDVPVDCISGEVDWVPRTFNVPPGLWPLKWIYSKNDANTAGADRGWVDQVSFAAADIALAEAVDNASVNVTSSASAPWYGQSVHAATAADAAQSAPIEDGQHTWLQATVTGPGTLSFYWKVSSEAGYDFLRFYVDGGEIPAIPAISGEVDWTQQSLAIGSGAHVLTWAYWKDFYCCYEGLDAAWVDGIVFVSSAPDTQPPSVPAGLTATPVSPTQVDLSWTLSTDNIGVTEYRIYRDGVQVAAVPGLTQAYSDTGLGALTAYSYGVAACDAAGNCSAPSAPVSVTTLAPPDLQPPTVPLGLTAAAAGPDRVELAWAAASDDRGVAAYQIYRDGVLITNVSAATLTYADTGLSAATRYSYTVAACDAAGNCSARSASASVVTQSSFQPALALGWTLLGNSFSTTLDVAALFGNQDNPVAGLSSQVVSVWKWNAQAGHWAFYSPQLSAAATASYAASRGFEVLETIAPGEGYWVNSISSLVLPVQSGAAYNWNSFSFSLLPAGFNLIAHNARVSPSQFNIGMSLAPPTPGSVPTDNFLSLWVWDAVRTQWYFHSPLLEANGGLAAVRQYATEHFHLHFEDYGRTLGTGTGFWVNRP